MPINKKTQQKKILAKGSLKLKTAEDLLNKHQKTAKKLLLDNKKEAKELLYKNQKTAEELLNKNEKKALELLGFKNNKGDHKTGEKEITAKNLIFQNKKLAEKLLVANKKNALELLDKSQKVALELLDDNQEKARALIVESKLVVENSVDAIIGTTLDGMITSWNGGATKIFGYSAEEVIGKSGSTLFPPEMWARVPSLLKKIKRKEVVTDYEIAGLHKNGTIFQLAISISPIVLKNGRVVGASIVERDISIRKKAEEEVRQGAELLKKSEELLRVSEARYRGILEASPECIKLFNTNGKLEYINQAGLEEHRIKTVEEARKSNFAKLIVKKDQAKFTVAFKKALSGKKTVIEIQHTKIGATSEFCSETMAPVLNDTGKVIGIFGISRDVTEERISQKKIEDLARFPEENRNPVMRVTEDGVVLYENNVCSDLRKKTKGSMLKSMLPIIQKAYTSNKGIEVEKTYHSRYFSFSITPIKSGGYVNIYGRDISERVKAEKSLQESESKYRAIIENVRDQIFMIDKQGIYLSVNERLAKSIGKTPAQIIGKSIAQVYPKETAKQFLKNIQELFKVGESKTIEEVIQLPGGDIYSSSQLNPVKDEKGKVCAVAGLVRDITEEKKAEKSIRDLDLLKTRFITALTHVTRTPLTAIRWNLEALLSGDFGSLSDQQKVFAHNALTQEDLVLRLIENMNIVLDIERKTMTLEKSMTSLSSIVSSVLGTFQHDCSEKELKCISANNSSVPPAIEIDSEKIRKVLDLIVDNAIHYTPAKGSITLNVSQTKSDIRIDVKDTGIGIPKAEQAQIFDRFFRASNATASHTSGVGVGLYIAKAIVEAHGGTIGFKSVEGKGSTFWITLPLV